MRLARVSTRDPRIKAIWTTSQFDTEFSPMSSYKYVWETYFHIPELIKSHTAEFAFQAAVYPHYFPPSPGPGNEANVNFS
jgi:hypothetical protein